MIVRFLVFVIAAAMLPTFASAQNNSLGSSEPVAIGRAAAADVRATAIKRYTLTRMANYVEYNFLTCTQIDTGSWTINTNPTYGTITLNTRTAKLADGSCPNTTFTFAAINYTWNAHNNKSKSDTFSATYKSVTFTQPETYSVNVPVVRPASETTVFGKWSTSGPGQWAQTLVAPADDPTFDFSGERVREYAAGTGGPDTCWFTGSAYTKFTGITGGDWTIIAGNKWNDYDNVGWFKEAINYYRRKGRAPCGTTFPQQMKIKSPADAGFANYGKVNTLGGSFTSKTITSTRAGLKKTIKK